LELLGEFGEGDPIERAPLWEEADEILSIIVTAIKSAKARR